MKPCARQGLFLKPQAKRSATRRREAPFVQLFLKPQAKQSDPISREALYVHTSTRFSAVADTLLALFWFEESEKHLVRPRKCISSNRIGLVKNRASMLTYRPKCITEIG